MRIALDARTVYRRVRRGTGKNLIDLYSTVAHMRPDWQITAYHREEKIDVGLLPFGQVQPKQIEMVGDRFDAWEKMRLPAAAWREGADVLHCPANTCPKWMPINTVVTIHDLIPLDMPHGRPTAAVKRFEQSIRIASRRAAGIITPSRYTADRLINEFDADPSRITVNAWAADSAMEKVEWEDAWPTVEQYGVSSPYVLHFGAIAPRKNTHRMIEAWSRISARKRRNWKLLVVGLDDEIKRDLNKRISNLGLQDTIRLHGFADEADLPALLSGAEILAYPSLSEGFGLPLLDAWQVETAVLTSNVTSLPEVAGDAAEIVDPTDSGAIASGLSRLMNDSILRDDLCKAGKQRLKQYTWAATAERFIGAMEQAAGGATVPLRRAA